ncbi:MAG: pyridoxal-phosphate dependent enzyme [Altibacter sp.]|uniref:threonine ammonia-lyase n=1 Tax=Altibacter sp. TaxID=2024823 RepID=UPI001DBA4251|nr:pyridoxal-phosphate dependent enzyme [Altibacter sp.]MBZ0328369.1 pyridoxal-phosphate dependent enzyme [Altibacter sp.]
MIPLKQDLEEAYYRVRPYVHRTPVLTSSFLNTEIGAEVYLKCENFQKMGAFKMRGATNAILQLSNDQRRAGVVTHSSGNFGQAVALAARNLGVKAYIVMPSNAPTVKKDAVRGYGGIITETEPTLAAREAASEKIKNEIGASFLHPSNDINVILGNATATMELLEVQPELDLIFAPVGGGGLVAGTALAAHYFGMNCRTYGGEPFEADDAYRSLQSGFIERNSTTNTIADGLRTNLGTINFPIIKSFVQEIIRVEEGEIIAAMRWVWERMKLVVEPSSAVALAALNREKERFKNQKVGLLISGGNVDFSNLPF